MNHASYLKSSSGIILYGVNNYLHGDGIMTTKKIKNRERIRKQYIIKCLVNSLRNIRTIKQTHHQCNTVKSHSFLLKDILSV